MKQEGRGRWQQPCHGWTRWKLSEDHNPPPCLMPPVPPKEGRLRQRVSGEHRRRRPPSAIFLSYSISLWSPRTPTSAFSSTSPADSCSRWWCSLSTRRGTWDGFFKIQCGCGWFPFSSSKDWILQRKLHTSVLDLNVREAYEEYEEAILGYEPWCGRQMKPEDVGATLSPSLPDNIVCSQRQNSGPRSRLKQFEPPTIPLDRVAQLGLNPMMMYRNATDVAVVPGSKDRLHPICCGHVEVD